MTARSTETHDFLRLGECREHSAGHKSRKIVSRSDPFLPIITAEIGTDRSIVARDRVFPIHRDNVRMFPDIESLTTLLTL
jgi:hypothetical protein